MPHFSIALRLPNARLSAARLCAGLLASFAVTAGAQTAPTWPTKPVRFIVPYAAGGSVGAATRIFTQKLSEIWGQAVIVDNRPGGNTIIGTQAAARSPADGYTLLSITNTHVINPWLQAKLPYDAIKDFTAVATLTRSDYMLAAANSFAPNNLKEFIAYTKANPGKVNSVANGLGTGQHLVNELFMDATGTRFTVVPYNGGGQSTTDLIGGVVQVSFNNLLNLASHVKAGQLKGIAISGDKRNPLLPDLPTFAEAGLPTFNATNWFGVLAPAGTPKDILQKINADIAKVQNMPDVKAALAKQGLDPFPNSVASADALVKLEYERLGKVIRDKGIKVESE